MIVFNIQCFVRLLMLIGLAAIANSADLRCFEGSFDKYAVISLEDPLPLLNETCYKPERDTVFYAFGFLELANFPSSKAIVETYLGLGNVNILQLNWEKENRGLLGPASYITVAVPNAKKIGEKFGEALVKLDKAGLKLTKVTLIGFSLGAQLVASTGKKVQESNLNVSRIMGIDPAGPLYEGNQTLLLKSRPRLDASCAPTVYAFHTNPGELGTDDSIATADFWFNCESSIQPECRDNIIGAIFCSHDMVWKYLTEALVRPGAFVARSATSCKSWYAGNGTNETFDIGSRTDNTARGSYYLRTSAASPYGLGEEGSQPPNIASSLTINNDIPEIILP